MEASVFGFDAAEGFGFFSYTLSSDECIHTGSSSFPLLPAT